MPAGLLVISLGLNSASWRRPSQKLAVQHPNLLTQKRTAAKTSIQRRREVVWLNPFHPEVAGVHHRAGAGDSPANTNGDAFSRTIT